MNYGQMVKQIRNGKGIKACYVAKKLGLTPGGYSGIERGRSRLTATYAQQIADILEVDIKDIFFTSDVSVPLIYSNLGDGNKLPKPKNERQRNTI